MTSNAVLTPAQVAALSPTEQAQLAAARQSAALLQATSRAALANSSDRFASLQQLISAIGSADGSEGGAGSEGADHGGAGDAAERATRSSRCSTRSHSPRNGPARSACASKPSPTRARFAAAADGTLRAHPMGFFAEFNAWLNALLAGYIGDNTARIAGALEPAVVTLGRHLRDGLGVSAAHRADRGALHRRGQADHHAGRHPGLRAASVALQQPHRRYVLQCARAARGGRRRRL